jgi:hypothetical protein
MAHTQASFLSEEEVRELRRILFGDQPDGFVNNRVYERHPFSATQFVAAVIPGLPTREKSFRQVLCNDISTDGISFFWPTCPHFRHVYVALGRKPNLTWIKARVCHHRKTDRQEGEYLVGCEFLARAASLASLLATPTKR